MISRDTGMRYIHSEVSHISALLIMWGHCFSIYTLEEKH